METGRRTEVERKYEVGPDARLPDLSGAAGVAAVGEPVEQRLEAVYYDTANLDLAGRGVTLRRRTGGDDAGWHLKVPQGQDGRSEMALPLGRAVKTVPERLLPPVRSVVRDRPLGPVATLVTRRVERVLVGADGVVLAHLCDDRVQAVGPDGTGTHEWREWEVELVDGDRALLAAVEEHLLAAGAAPAAAASKLARALGDADQAPHPPARRWPAPGSVGHLLAAHLAEQRDRLHGQDALVRTDEAASVHQMRIAVRRLRSALATYRPLFRAGSTDEVAAELRWLGQTLGGARDAQVLGEGLKQLVEAQPAELVLGPVLRRVDAELRAGSRAGREQAREALDSDRYYRLLDALDELVEVPPLTPRAGAPAKDVVPDLLRRDTRRLRRAVQAAERAGGRAGGPAGKRAGEPNERDLALHEARKKAKRLRYGAESAVPVLGSRAKRLATRAKRVQESLGQHQDAVVARQKLREYAVQAHLSGENGFTFGRLHALEEWRADTAEREFADAFARLPRRKVRRWLRGR